MWAVACGKPHTDVRPITPPMIMAMLARGGLLLLAVATTVRVATIARAVTVADVADAAEAVAAPVADAVAAASAAHGTDRVAVRCRDGADFLRGVGPVLMGAGLLFRGLAVADGTAMDRCGTV